MPHEDARPTGEGDARTATADPSPARLLARSAGAGVAAYLAVFAAVGGLFALDFAHNLGRGGDAGLVRSVQRLGWVVYNAHLVPTDVWLRLNFVELSAARLTLPPLAYYAVPPVALTAVGWAVARRAPAGATRVLAGAGVAAGYLPAAVVGAVAVTTPEGGPSLVLVVLLAGVVYPVACGTVGGLLADR